MTWRRRRTSLHKVEMERGLSSCLFRIFSCVWTVFIVKTGSCVLSSQDIFHIAVHKSLKNASKKKSVNINITVIWIFCVLCFTPFVRFVFSLVLNINCADWILIGICHCFKEQQKLRRWRKSLGLNCNWVSRNQNRDKGSHLHKTQNTVKFSLINVGLIVPVINLSQKERGIQAILVMFWELLWVKGITTHCGWREIRWILKGEQIRVRQEPEIEVSTGGNWSGSDRHRFQKMYRGISIVLPQGKRWN